MWRWGAYFILLIITPVAYAYVMAHWVSLYVNVLTVTPDAAALNTVLQMAVGNLVGIVVIALATGYLVKTLFPEKVRLLNLFPGVAIVLVSVFHLSGYLEQGLNSITLLEWLSVLVVFPIVGVIMQSRASKARREENA